MFLSRLRFEEDPSLAKRLKIRNVDVAPEVARDKLADNVNKNNKMPRKGQNRTENNATLGSGSLPTLHHQEKHGQLRYLLKHYVEQSCHINRVGKVGAQRTGKRGHSKQIAA